MNAPDTFATHTWPEKEAEAIRTLDRNFEQFPTSTRQKLEAFPNWVRHRDIARLLYKAEIYKSILTVPGCIFECGVLYGAGVSTWLHLREIYEPVNFSRRIFGFDTFAGFPSVQPVDGAVSAGHFNVAPAKEAIFEAVHAQQQTAKLAHMQEVYLIEGDASITVPSQLQLDKSIVVALLYLDMDLYRPTFTVLEACWSRLVKGSVIVFDELNCKDWPGETAAALEWLERRGYTSIERSPIVPHMAVVRL